MKITLMLFIPTDVTFTCQDLVIIDRLNIQLSCIITVTALHTLAAVNTQKHKNPSCGCIDNTEDVVFGSYLFPEYSSVCA